MIKHIESELPLAVVFNKVISKITVLWIMTRPRIFNDIKGEDGVFKMSTYYQILLWEKWLHEVVKRLQEWVTSIDEYFDEFNGCWEYYALSKRLDFIDEYGTDDDEDYVVNSPYAWNENDLVSIEIAPEDIALRVKGGLDGYRVEE